MPIILPKPIADYFAADRMDGAAAARSFAEHAVVVDERKTYAGRDAIRRWKTEASAKYSYVSEPFAVTHDGDRILVVSRVTGNFPGSPIDLRYSFVLEGDEIVRLEIAP